ncbi:hypothetical protein [Atopomonas hussainii]|uniref:hypothetical protein n=1 Tax=Atopomonas hussainii TaxID=1429083 RepID=UPI000A83E5C7|nr:hypothetical protein [Atopomonas hussainii]
MSFSTHQRPSYQAPQTAEKVMHYPREEKLDHLYTRGTFIFIFVLFAAVVFIFSREDGIQHLILQLTGTPGTATIISTQTGIDGRSLVVRYQFKTTNQNKIDKRELILSPETTHGLYNSQKTPIIYSKIFPQYSVLISNQNSTRPGYIIMLIAITSILTCLWLSWRNLVAIQKHRQEDLRY